VLHDPGLKAQYGREVLPLTFYPGVGVSDRTLLKRCGAVLAMGKAGSATGSRAALDGSFLNNTTKLMTNSGELRSLR
jgi:hypothetical protein